MALSPTSSPTSPHIPVTTTLEIEGMTCGHCYQAVQDELTSMNDVESVVVDGPKGRATVTKRSDLATDAWHEGLRRAVDEAGYLVISITDLPSSPPPSP